MAGSLKVYNDSTNHQPFHGPCARVGLRLCKPRFRVSGAALPASRELGS